MFQVPEQYRVTTGPLGSTRANGNDGHFKIPLSNRSTAYIIASSGMGWEHVSVHIVEATFKQPNPWQDRTPTWAEMCKIKAAFWGEEDTVIQYHPPKSEYVNNHKHTLHLWRPIGVEIPRPPKILVGI